jgi:hypothetical protein
MDIDTRTADAQAGAADTQARTPDLRGTERRRDDHG